MNVPVWALKAVFGEGASMFTKGPKVVPGRFQNVNFPFQYPDIRSTLEDLWNAKEKSQTEYWISPDSLMPEE
jgi:NAD dependent epimerase/dehydratase family enzyme